MNTIKVISDFLTSLTNERTISINELVVVIDAKSNINAVQKMRALKLKGLIKYSFSIDGTMITIKKVK